MPISDADKEQMQRIRNLCDSLLKSGTDDRKELNELLALADRFEHMWMKSSGLRRSLTDYTSYKRDSKKEEAWSRVQSLIYDLRAMSSTE